MNNLHDSDSIVFSFYIGIDDSRYISQDFDNLDCSRNDFICCVKSGNSRHYLVTPF